MKTLSSNFISFLIIVFFLFGCKKDDDTNYREILISNVWDFKIIHDEEFCWNADVEFYDNGSTYYDEPDFPGQFIQYGLWTLEGNELFYALDSAASYTNYHFSGQMYQDSISGTYTWNGQIKNWFANPK